MTLLTPLPYHRAVADILERENPASFALAAARRRRGAPSDELDQALLRSTYRLDPTAHPEPHAALARAAAALGRDRAGRAVRRRAPAARQRRAGVRAGPGDRRGHRPARSTCSTTSELCAVLGHELAHHVLWTADGGRYLAATRLLDAAEHDARTPAEYLETARRFRLATELYADRGALLATGSARARGERAAQGARPACAASTRRPTCARRPRSTSPACRSAGTHPPRDGAAGLGAAAVARPPDGECRRARSSAAIAAELDLATLDLPGQDRLLALTRSSWCGRPTSRSSRCAAPEVLELARAATASGRPGRVAAVRGHPPPTLDAAGRDPPLPRRGAGRPRHRRRRLAHRGDLAAALALARRVGLGPDLLRLLDAELDLGDRARLRAGSATRRACADRRAGRARRRARRPARRRRARPAAAAARAGRGAPRDRPGRAAARARRASPRRPPASASTRRATAPTRNRQGAGGGGAPARLRGLDVRRGLDRQRDLSARRRVERRRPTSTPSRRRRCRIVAGWQRWEHLLGHHDELTDIGSLGELLAALLCGLDLADPERRRRPAPAAPQPVRARARPAPGASPAVVTLDGRARPAPPRPGPRATSPTRLRTYRDQPEDFDLDRVLAGGAPAPADRRAVVLAHLRDRLFDLSRRNPLLHFRPTRPHAQPDRGVGAAGARRAQRSGPSSCSPGAVRRPRGWSAGKAVDVGSLVRWDDAPYAERGARRGRSRRPAATGPSTAATSCASSSRSCAGTTCSDDPDDPDRLAAGAGRRRR